jgi:thymidylate kinase
MRTSYAAELATQRPSLGIRSRSDVARAFFERLGSSRIDYVALGDVRTDLTELRGDLDVAVGPEVLPTMARWIARFCREQALLPVQMLEHEQTAAYYVLAGSWNSPDPLFLAVDFCSDYYRKGRLLLRADELVNGTPNWLELPEARQRVAVPPAATAFIYYLIKKIDKGELQSRHGAYLTARFRDDPRGAENQSRRFWTGADLERICRAAESGEWAPVTSRLEALANRLRARRPRSFESALGETKRRIGRILRPTGVTLCVYGSDGSGKSTVLRMTESSLAPAFRRTKAFHLRPHFGFANAHRPPVLEPHAEPPRGWLASALKLAYWLADYTVGYAIVILPRLISSTFVLFDRYYHDLYVDPRRYRFRGPLSWARLVGKVIPQPDVTIWLDVSPRVANTRKPELAINELACQREAYARIMRDLGGAVADADAPLAHVLGHVNAAVLEHMARRTERRLDLDHARFESESAAAVSGQRS